MPGPATSRNRLPSSPGGGGGSASPASAAIGPPCSTENVNTALALVADLELGRSRDAARKLAHARHRKPGRLLRGGGVGDLADVGLSVTSRSP